MSTSPVNRLRLLASLLIMISVLVGGATLLAAPAHANVCQTCDPEPPPVPTGPKALYEVWGHGEFPGYNLIGHDAQDDSGYDELYLKINGTKVWGPQTVAAGPFPSPGNGQHAANFSYRYYTGLTQAPSFYISMFDDDTWPDVDDKLGGHQINLAPFAVGHTLPLDLKFTDGANYWLRINVTRIS